uniref:FXYD domain-containing ion transport regulator n=1 Tax=Varanus komodoensis TaxID=61221 RepID=A0A8D2JLT6_VARKO
MSIGLFAGRGLHLECSTAPPNVGGGAPTAQSPATYYETIRNGGLVFAVLAFLIGLAIIFSKCLGLGTGGQGEDDNL